MFIEAPVLLDTAMREQLGTILAKPIKAILVIAPPLLRRLLRERLKTGRAVQLSSEMLEPALRRCNPGADIPRRIVTDMLLMPAFQFGDPLVVFI